MRFIELLGGIGARVFKFYTQKPLKNPLETQENLLMEIVKKHKYTQFGKKHRFSEIQSVKQFQMHCKPQSYDYFKPYIDNFIAGKKKALFNSHFLFFAQTSGTTGAPKLIPVTYNTIKNYNLGVLRTACYYITEDLNANSKIISGKWLYLPAPPLLRYISGIPVGYITGLLMLPYGIQFWRYLLNFKCYAPLHLMHIRNAEVKFKRITEECISENISMVVGVTPVIINLLEYILKYSKASTIHELFPNLQLAIFSGVSPKYYRSRLNKLIGHPIAIREMYAASEGMLAVQLSKRPQLTPLYDSVFFEFIPLKDSTERLIISQIKKGEKYHLLITTHNGLYAYDIGDIVKITSEDPPAFEISFRKDVIDLADEKLTPTQISTSIKIANTQNQCKIIDFFVVGTYKPKPHYIFLIEFDYKRQPASYTKYLITIEKTLEKLNNIYYQNRKGANKGTLSPPELWILEPNTIHVFETQWVLDDLPTGQRKAIHLSKDPKVLKFLESFVIEKVSLNR